MHCPTTARWVLTGPTHARLRPTLDSLVPISNVAAWRPTCRSRRGCSTCGTARKRLASSRTRRRCCLTPSTITRTRSRDVASSPGYARASRGGYERRPFVHDPLNIELDLDPHCRSDGSPTWPCSTHAHAYHTHAHCTEHKLCSGMHMSQTPHHVVTHTIVYSVVCWVPCDMA